MLTKTVLSTLCMVSAMGYSAVAMAQTGHHAHGHTSVTTKESATDIVASQCWGRLRGANQASALYFTLENKDAKQAAYLVAANSASFGDVMLHESYEVNGMAGMRHVAEVAIAPASQLAFKPGSYHVMMEKPQEGLRIGEQIEVDLILSNGHKVTTSCLMKSIAARTFED
ncbi:MAG: copper chaperone PCu(A)C [Pelistega sp.]|nr:copper chaperone PCu(A)C [Pelistega sp.]